MLCLSLVSHWQGETYINKEKEGTNGKWAETGWETSKDRGRHTWNKRVAWLIKPAAVTSEHLPLSLQPCFPRSADSFLRAAYWGSRRMLYQQWKLCLQPYLWCAGGKDELRASLSAGLLKRKQENDSGETRLQWQVYSVLCSQSMSSLKLIYHTKQIHIDTHSDSVLLHCSENIIITSSSCLTRINFHVAARWGNSSFCFLNVLVIDLGLGYFLINDLL